MRLDRSQSIVSCEVNRNRGNGGRRAVETQTRADAQRRCPKILRFVASRKLYDMVAAPPTDDHSPQQATSSF